jgi:hypothetical protein
MKLENLLPHRAHSAAVVAVALAVCTPLFSAGPVTPTKPIVLFNGRDFTGWTFYSREGPAAAAKTWKVEDGVIKSTGTPSGYIQTVGRYRDYKLTAQWRWTPGPPPKTARGEPRSRNSGVLVHSQGVHIPAEYGWPKSLECQLVEGNAGDIWVIGGVETTEWRQTKAKAVAAAAKADDATKKKADTLRRVPKFKESSEKPPGEWNTYEIVCRGDTITLTVNGVEQNRATRVSVQEGHICLQAEGAPVEFRNVKLEPLPR